MSDNSLTSNDVSPTTDGGESLLEGVGYLTAYGTHLSTKGNWLALQRGRHIAQVQMTPLQWQLLGTGIVRAKQGHQVTVTIEPASTSFVRVGKSAFPDGLQLTIKGRYKILTVPLYATEVDELLKAAHLRYPQAVTTNQQKG